MFLMSRSQIQVFETRVLCSAKDQEKQQQTENIRSVAG